MAQVAGLFRVQRDGRVHFKAEGSVSEIVWRLRRHFLPGLSDADLDQPVRIVFATNIGSGGRRLLFRKQAGLEGALRQFKRGFLDCLTAEDSKRKGVLKILGDRKVIRPDPSLWAAARDDRYVEFFGLSENPFMQTPNPRFFYASPMHTEAISRLTYAINGKRGFALITGEIGSGKTTVCRTALRSLSRRARVALITSTFLTRNELLIALCEEFDVEPARRRKVNYLRALQHYLIEQYQRDRLVVLVLDEAQNLSSPVLEEVRMLSNLETEEEKLIQIVLLGQPELCRRIETADLEQLRQRVAVRYHLDPLDAGETQKYIEHRLDVAGGGKIRFSEAAYGGIFRHSGGIPRLINGVAEACLREACHQGKVEITEEIVGAAILDLEGKPRDGVASHKRNDKTRPKNR